MSKGDRPQAEVRRYEVPALPVFVMLALLGSVLQLQQDQSSEWRPIRDVTGAPTIEDLDFGSFSFKLPGIYHSMTAQYGSIDTFDTEGVLHQNWVNEGTPPC